MSERFDVVVVGSVNADLVLSLDRIPGAGETVLARGRESDPGGKGANQAVAASRAGASTAFVGAVGRDPEADMLRQALTDAGVDVSTLRTVDGPSGLAVVSVDAEGQNSIVVAAGANDAVTSLDGAEGVVRQAGVVLCQLEIPIEGVLAAARAADGRMMLNAAPSHDLPAELWDRLDLLVVNEHEAADLSGRSPDAPEESASVLLERVGEVVITLGGAGSLYAARNGQPVRVGARTVDVVDTTGAGDTFCGVLAAGLARGEDIRAALERATAASALSVQRAGAIASIPSAAQIDEMLAADR